MANTSNDVTVARAEIKARELQVVAEYQLMN